MQLLELMRYLGISYAELMETPQHILQAAGVRMTEESEYHAHLARQSEKKR